MKIKKLSIPEKIKLLHTAEKVLSGMVFDECIEERYLIWYAQERLYIVRDTFTDGYYFKKARSPQEAIDMIEDGIWRR